MTPRGAIYNAAAYVQGKMLDHSAWSGKLARNITPSDIDIVFDANGKIIFCELSSSTHDWCSEDIKTGQRLLYQNVIWGGVHCSCLCRHMVPPDCQIDTRNDIQSFHVMLWHRDRYIYSPIFAGELWPRFVDRWVNEDEGPWLIRRKLLRIILNGQMIEHDAAQIVPPQLPPLYVPFGDLFGGT